MSALVSGARWVAIEAVVSKILQLLSALYVARVLGPEVMGTVALILVALEIFKLFSEMGITQALIHHKEPTSKQIATLYTLNWVLALFTYSAIYFSTPYVGAFFENELLSELMRVAGLSVLISALGQQMFALLQKELDFRVLAIISMISSVVNLIVAISLVALGWGVWSIIIAQLSAALIRSCCAFAYGCWNKLFNGFGFSFKAVKPMLSFGLYQTGAMSLNMINSRADQIIIGKTMGSVTLGFYSMGTQITLQAMQQINGVATRVAFPAVSKAQDNLDEVRRIYLAMIANVLLISAPLFIGLAVVSPVFVDVVLGEKWNELSSLLSILCGYVLVRSLANMNGPLVMGMGKARWAFYWNLGLLFIIPGVIYVSSLSGSVEWVAMALLATQIVLVTVAYFYWVRRLVGSCAKKYMATLARPLLSAGLMGAALEFIYGWLSWDSDVVTLFALVLLGAILYLVFSMVFNSVNAIGFLHVALKK